MRDCPRSEVCTRGIETAGDVCVSEDVLMTNGSLTRVRPRIVRRTPPKVCLGRRVRVPRSDPTVKGDKIRERCCKRFRIGCIKEGGMCAKKNSRGQRVLCDRRFECVIDRFAFRVIGKCRRVRGEVKACNMKTCASGGDTLCRTKGSVTTCSAAI